jgi:hypothetical protein
LFKICTNPNPSSAIWGRFVPGFQTLAGLNCVEAESLLLVSEIVNFPLENNLSEDAEVPGIAR